EARYFAPVFFGRNCLCIFVSVRQHAIYNQAPLAIREGSLRSTGLIHGSKRLRVELTTLANVNQEAKMEIFISKCILYTHGVFWLKVSNKCVFIIRFFWCAVVIYDHIAFCIVRETSSKYVSVGFSFIRHYPN